jgi:hypothetical protein
VCAAAPAPTTHNTGWSSSSDTDEDECAGDVSGPAQAQEAKILQRSHAAFQDRDGISLATDTRVIPQVVGPDDVPAGALVLVVGDAPGRLVGL